MTSVEVASVDVVDDEKMTRRALWMFSSTVLSASPACVRL